MAVPVSLKAISPYLKTAQEYDKRDPVVAYYCKYSLKYFFGCCEVFSVKAKMEAKGETGNILLKLISAIHAFYSDDISL